MNKQYKLCFLLSSGILQERTEGVLLSKSVRLQFCKENISFDLRIEIESLVFTLLTVIINISSVSIKHTSLSIFCLYNKMILNRSDMQWQIKSIHRFCEIHRIVLAMLESLLESSTIYTSSGVCFFSYAHVLFLYFLYKCLKNIVFTLKNAHLDNKIP